MEHVRVGVVGRRAPWEAGSRPPGRRMMSGMAGEEASKRRRRDFRGLREGLEERLEADLRHGSVTGRRARRCASH